MHKRFLTLLAAGAMGAFTSSAALADYPEKDIRVIVPWGAGGGTDGIVRKLTSIAEKNLGTSMYVENIEGGISATGISQVMSARPDGYTIGALTYDSVVTVPWQGLLPSYDMEKLKLIARVTSEPDAIIVDSDTPYDTFEDLLAAVKENPDSVKVGIQNIGSRLHLAILQLQDETDTKFKIIAYPGGAAPQKEAILNDEVDVVATSLGDFAPLLESGDVRGILEFSETTNPTFNTVPTAKEAGLDLRIGSFIVLAAPAGTPDEAINAIEQAYKEALESDEFQTWVASVGVTPDWLGTDEVTQWADETSQTLFDQMDMLVEQGIIKK
ncbi:Bug family tripartite tricarboxylate transporter substrate binding protein [Chelativorans xinjiangense]|uniref:Bug family tripartite tricarboxylate transporter substrate binding protein n=1 Tax=Chelativorans xinjiangense TaxID=2681485 RepID=UPI00135C7D6E|nr:tripartite tricarboxylate transporter substrate binding protein [Chelativorans xinjiangense]